MFLLYKPSLYLFYHSNGGGSITVGSDITVQPSGTPLVPVTFHVASLFLTNVPVDATPKTQYVDEDSEEHDGKVAYHLGNRMSQQM